MLIALLAVLGVDLVVIVVFVGFIVGRKRWVKRQPGIFRGVVRVADGEVDGLRPKWSRGYGRWVRYVFVWTKGPFLFRNELVAADGLGEATVEMAADEEHPERLLGPYRRGAS